MTAASVSVTSRLAATPVVALCVRVMIAPLATVEALYTHFSAPTSATNELNVLETVLVSRTCVAPSGSW